MSRTDRAKRKRLQLNEFRKQVFHNKDAKPGIFPLVVVLDNLKPDFNIGKILRSAAAFGARSVHIIGTGYFDPHPAKGAMKLVPIKFHSTYRQCIEELKAENYSIFALDLGAENEVGTFTFPEKTAIILGNEGLGITFDYKRWEIPPLSIPQLGKMDSLNVSVAASISIFEYARQMRNNGFKIGATEIGSAPRN